MGGADHLLITSQDFFADPDGQPGRIWLRSRATPRFEFSVTPPLGRPLQASLPLTRSGARGPVDRFTAEAGARDVKLEYRLLRAAGEAPAVKLGAVPQGVAQAPAAGELPQAAKWSITVPPGAMDGLSELFLQVKYQGDVARLSQGQRLLTDDFYNGRPWSIGLHRFLDPRSSNAFELSILPLRQDAPVYFELPGRPDFSLHGQVGRLDGMSLVPEYQLVVEAGDR
jgi:hypothetical protein